MPRALLFAGHRKDQLGDHVAAEKHLRQIKVDRDSPNAAEVLLGKYVLLARIHDLKMHDTESAMKYARRLLKRSENDATPQYRCVRHLALLEVARLSMHLGELEQARTFALEVLELIADHEPQKRVMTTRALAYAIIVHTKRVQADEEGMRHYSGLWTKLMEPRVIPFGVPGKFRLDFP